LLNIADFLGKIAIRAGRTTNIVTVVLETSHFEKNNAPFISTAKPPDRGLKMLYTVNNFQGNIDPNC